MAQHIFRYQGDGAAPAHDFDRIRATPGVKITDSSPNMVLVEAEAEDADRLAEMLINWLRSPERTYRVPDTRQRIDKLKSRAR